MQRSFLAQRTPLAAAIAVVIALAAGSAAAHTLDDGIPQTNGLRIDMAAVAAYLHGDSTLPAPKLAGTLGLGDTPDDQRGWRLEHGTLGAGLRVSPQLGANIAMGWHDSDPAHVEAAWMEARSGSDAELTLGAGRNRVPMGQVLTRAGHFDRYGQMPLAKRAAFNGDWIEDGINAAWRPHLQGAMSWLQGIDLGLWRARRFPGSDNAAWAPVVHASAAWTSVQADVFYSRMQPKGRGAYVQRSNSGHIHTAPQCNASLRDITCFDGTVDLAGASATWTTPLPGVQLTAAGIWRRESGSLYSQNGDTRYQGRTLGGWLEVLWQPRARWEFGARQEWLRSTNRVSGPGALLVATDANLLPNNPSRRFTAMAGWRPVKSVLIALEAGREHIAGKGHTVAGLRLIWTPDALLERNWK